MTTRKHVNGLSNALGSAPVLDELLQLRVGKIRDPISV